MKTCPACQETYPDDTAFCLLDGTRLASPIAVADAQLAAGLSRHFRILRRLGKGGMGTVFLAEQIGVGNRHVALKVLNRKFLDDPDFLLRFQNEAGSTGRIHHLNVVTIHESAQGDDGTPYIAMEFLEGESLREVLHRQGALPVTEVAEILLQAARGLNAMHKLGIVHRDLKPDNIFLTHGDEGELGGTVVEAYTGRNHDCLGNRLLIYDFVRQVGRGGLKLGGAGEDFLDEGPGPSRAFAVVPVGFVAPIKSLLGEVLRT